MPAGSSQAETPLRPQTGGRESKGGSVSAHREVPPCLRAESAPGLGVSMGACRETESQGDDTTSPSQTLAPWTIYPVTGEG